MSASGRATRERSSGTNMAPRRHPSRLTVVVVDDKNAKEDKAEQATTTEHDAPADAHRPARAPMTVRGPLLAVCGLCGGAGTSTLALLVAVTVTREGAGAVLVGDTGGPSGGLSSYAGVAAPRSLDEAAEHIGSGLPTGQLVASTDEGLRVLATEPRVGVKCAPDGIELLLDHARERYALTVIDCGTLAREADQVALGKASHVAWVLPASGARRAWQVLKAVHPYPASSELIVARHDERVPKAAIRELRQLAEQRRATLVLFPSVPDLGTGKLARALELAQVSLQAIAGVLRR